MPWTAIALLLLLALLALGAWGVVSIGRLSRRSSPPPLTAAEISGLAQPYRGLVGEMLETWRAVARTVSSAPPSIQRELTEVAARLGDIVARALPRARYGTRLLEYRDSLPPADEQRGATGGAAQAVVDDLRGALVTLRSVQGKVYQLLADANALEVDDRLHADLDDALIDVESLEEAFREVREEML